MTGEDFGFSGSSSTGSSSSSGGGTNGTRRTNVFIKGEYGTEVFLPDTECVHCSTQATGVLVIDPDDESEKEKRYDPLCTRHKENEEKEVEMEWATTEFKRFA